MFKTQSVIFIPNTYDYETTHDKAKPCNLNSFSHHKLQIMTKPLFTNGNNTSTKFTILQCLTFVHLLTISYIPSNFNKDAHRLTTATLTM